ncbi:hypothetical protein [Sphingomonas melonis]|uniref:hypothetical protein n=1 Tax=Sphingomonas melonis TaxID=152682 RepID=UPI0035C7D644
MSDLPTIHTDTDWIELAIDDQAIIIGKLDRACGCASAAIVIVTTAWEMFVVDVSRAFVPPALHANTPVRATIERVEDGMTLVNLEKIEA